MLSEMETASWGGAATSAAIACGDSDLDSKPVTGEKRQQSTGDNSSRGGATAQASAEEALATALWGSG